MAEELNQGYVDHLSSMDRPMAGSSLTNDPEQPFPFEKAPEYTNVRQACEHIFETIIEEETYIPLMQAIADGYPLMDVTQAILFKGFSEGKWNPDLFVLLAEPTAYMLMALAERADIDFVINRGEEEDDEEEEELFGIKYDEDKLKKLKEAKAQAKIPKGAFPIELVEKLEKLEIPPIAQEESLLSKPASPEEVEEEEEEEQPPPSLMAPPT